MKTLQYSVVISFFLCINILSQNQTPQDPLQGHYNMGTSDEITLFWRNTNDGYVAKHQVFDYYGNSGQYYLDSAARGVYSGNLGTAENGNYPGTAFDAISGDFNGDGYDNIIAAWETKDSSINIVVPKNIDKNSLTWNDQNSLTLTNVLYPNAGFSAHKLKLVKGFFDGDPEPEFALAYWNKDGNIEIRVYDVDPNTLMPVEKASIADVYNDPSLNNSGIYDIAAGDFDGDGRDEIVLVNYTERSDHDWNISAKIYDYVENNGNFTLVPKGEKNDYFTNNDFFDSYHHINDLLVGAGDFKDNTLDQFVVDFVLYRSGSETYNKMLPAYVTTDLDTIKVDKNNLKDIFQTLGTQTLAINLVTGDINNDGKDEIIINGDGRLRIYDIDTTLSIQGYTSGDYGSSDRIRPNLVLADLDASTADSVWNPEIISASTQYYQPDNGSSYTTFTITVFEPTVDASGDIIALNKRATMTVDSTDGPRSYYWALTAGDFDGGGIRLGAPKYYSVTDIVQPLVILNAPPTHFDVFNDSTFDVNKSYEGNDTQFYSEFYSSSESEIEVETENHSSWTIGAEVSGGFKIPVIKTGVEYKIKGEYGKDFSKQTINTHTTKVSETITAGNDDYIYAVINNYDIWEYPIIANDTTQGYTLVVTPKLTTKAWFPSKSPEADQYLPNHEVDNILSYREIGNPFDNSFLSQVVKWDSTAASISVDQNTAFSYAWSLENSSSTQEITTNKSHWSLGGEVTFSLPFKLVHKIKLSGDYSSESISTQTSKATYTKGLDVHLGPVDPSIGEDYYSIKPYSYWSTSGALVLDYSVRPSAAGPGQPETWWQEKYGHKSDPALILPWRLDNYKGSNLSAVKLQQTKEILFSNDTPNPGDVINVQLRIHNFSFVNTPGPVNARFYIGDPNSGGTLIQSTDGKSEFTTNDYIPQRGSTIISFDWKIPSNLSYYPRIYAVLDPENQIDEIHEGNNIGWKVLNYSGGTTGIEDKKSIPVSFKLSQNYPNPFNPTTTIEYTIPQSRFVSLKVYDILGREVKTLVNRQELPGTHKVQFNGNGIASGVYFYRIQAGEFISTKKFVLLK